MSEIQKQPLLSAASLEEELVHLGLENGMHLIVHSSLRMLGRVVGGPAAVLMALESVLGDNGTLVMPTFTEKLCDPGEPENYFPEDEQDFVRAHLPIYSPDLTPVDRSIGFLPETFRKQAGTVRSSHPHLSFAARGVHAGEIISQHSFDYALGEGSPLRKLYDLQGFVLLLAAPANSNTSLHLAEYRLPREYLKPKNWDVCQWVDGERRWVQYRDIENNCDDFPRILEAFQEARGFCRSGKTGAGWSHLISQPELVDFGVSWMTLHRPRS